MSYESEVLADGPAMYWRFGESAGTTAQDETANNRDGTYVGCTLGQTGAVFGDADTAVDLDGIDDFVRGSYNPFTNATVRTFEGWANRDVTGAVHALFGGVGNPSPQMTIASAGPASTVEFRPDRGQGGAGDIASWTSAWPGTAQWVHWVLIFDESADTAELYINNVSQGVVSGVTRAYPASPGNFVAGSVVDGALSWFDGRMDEVAVYESALSATRIGVHYTVGTTGFLEQTAIWPFNRQGPF